jgi:hypothetical protein
MGWKWTEEQLREYNARFKAKANAHPALQAPYLEPAPRHGSLAKKAGPRVHSQYRVRCITRGRRLGDVDGRSIKAVLDGFTKAGIWPDDSTKFVKEVCFTQEPAEEDETVIELWEV